MWRLCISCTLYFPHYFLVYNFFFDLFNNFNSSMHMLNFELVSKEKVSNFDCQQFKYRHVQYVHIWLYCLLKSLQYFPENTFNLLQLHAFYEHSWLCQKLSFKGKEKFHLSVIKTIAAIVQFTRVKQKEQFSIECCK